MPAPERTELVEAVTAGAPAARVCGRDPAPGWGSHAEVMRLQRAAGNRAVAREGRRRLQRSGDDPVGYPAPAPPYSPPSPPVPVRPRVPAPAPAPDPAPAPAPACPTPFTKASSFQTLISLVSAAEARLTANGITTPKEQIHALRGIYYGTTWSMDYAKAQGGKGEKSATRNEGFQRFTRPSEEPALTVPVDVRPMLDCGLFEALRDSPEVTDPGGRHVDVGHLVIGLDARFDPAFKNEAIFKASVGPITKDVPMGGTGLECVTWLGDLGGGAASLAIKRVGAPATSASTVFAGSDYGGSINLEGDVAAFVVAGGGAALVAPTFAPGTRLSDALTAYLSPSAPSAAWNTRVSSFLTMYNGTLDASGAVTNRSALVSTFQPKIQTFACNYLASRVKDGHVTYEAAKTAGTHITGASREVAEAFVDALAASAGSGAKLEATKFPSPSAPGEQACPLQVAMGKLGGVLGL